MDIKVKFDNLERITVALAATGKEGAREAARALRHEAQEVLTQSLDEVPVDTGALKASGRVNPASGVILSGENIMVEVVFGSTATSYAIPVHENLEAHHPHGKAKYLEGPLLRQLNGISGRIADRVMSTQKGMLR
jgi:hypothetical protein